ncbi:unnamed protein product [Meloidogyne enterolobii]|uniref:Uncharacterized protein n=1 Tax=Meloidogyne enterolobii TaxID=390850 RepID=A0ACB1A735_MELEN
MSAIGAKKSGLAAEVQQSVHVKFDSQFAQQIFGWISSVTGETLPSNGDINEFISTLKDGVLLCKLVNALSRNSDEKVNNSVLPFRYAANIAYFLSFVGNYVGKNELFKTVDLYEGQDPNSVLVCLAALARKSEKVFGKPGLGPKEAGGGTSRQPKAAEPIIGLQAGSSKGATQSGMVSVLILKNEIWVGEFILESFLGIPRPFNFSIYLNLRFIMFGWFPTEISPKD